MATNNDIRELIHMIGSQLRQAPEFSPIQPLPMDIVRKFEILARSEAQSALDDAARTQRGDAHGMCIAGAQEDDSDGD